MFLGEIRDMAGNSKSQSSSSFLNPTNVYTKQLRQPRQTDH